MARSILVVSNRPDSAWLQMVSDALQSLGKLQVASEQEASVRIKVQGYDLMIVDATAVSSDIATLVARLREDRPDVPIVVVTASPTWQRARRVFLAGATDYIRRSFDGERILASCQEILEGSHSHLPSSWMDDTIQ